MFSHFFIRRPIFAAVIAIVIVLLGSFALKGLPIERYPNIAPPAITVSAAYPGADANTVADTVAAVIEKEVNGVEGMIYMSSVSANDGTMKLTVTFKTGIDLDMANVLVQNRVAIAIPQLPQEVQRLGVSTKKKSTDANLYIGFTSTDENHDDIFLANYVALRVKDEVARVPGVGEVMAFGAGNYSMRVWLDPDKMKARGLTADDVVNAVKEQNLQVAAGQIGEPPVPSGQAHQMTIQVKGRLLEAEEFGAIVIRTGNDGRVLRIRDIANVELGAQNYIIRSSLNGKPSSTIAVYQIPGENALAVVDGVRAKMEELKPGFPEGMDYTIVYDNTVVIKASIKEVVVTLFITLILVVFTVYIFLQNVRATIVPSVTIPVSLIGTFAAMSALGYSINQFTLFGLVLVIGIVVDDAIVVVENCTRLIDEEGLSPKEAALRAMSEISGPVIATTLVLLSVFIPTTFMPGITGTLFKQFAVTISVATVFSTINALTLSPALCSILLRRSKGETQTGVFGLFNKSLDSTKKGYLKVVNQALRKSFIGLVVFLAMSALAFIGFSDLPGGFVPQEDEGYCMVNVLLPDASALERTDEFIREVNAIIGGTDGIADYMTIAGYSILDGAAIPNAAFSVATFKHWDERKNRHQSEIIRELNMKLSQLKDGVAFSFPMPSLPGVGMSGGLVMQLQDRGGAGMGTLQQVAEEFMNDGNSQSGLQGMYTTFRANVPQLFVDIDRDQVLTKNVSMSAVFNALQYFYGSVYMNDFTYMNRVFQVRAQAAGEYRREASQIRDMEIRNRDGKMLPLGSVVSIEEILGPQSVNRYNMYPSAKIMGQPGDGYSTGQAMAIVENMGQQKLPASMGVEWTELSYQEKAAQGSSNIIYVLAIILVYLVLAAQYESWSIPVSVCLSVPTALLGAVIALKVAAFDNNVYAQVGIVLLIGLCTKTAILIVEFAKVEHEEGKSVFEAAMSASNLRFRAVLMTAFSFILGVIPLLTASGAGAESRKVLGATVFGGMLVATVASLIFVPMLYYIVQVMKEKSSKQPVPKEDAE
ncbi:Efflux pump membrane transporter BepG [Pontiella desulfatans]|uniref:Efflux pump membrane transporter BepG n=1 Tax=Pontiella desulfatans TaxID=2750659 RepID=A0A6C2UCK3_PONDE|nr:multidrug efflux RND transporter permease subunit [Pontiella desulfatans]VGO17870.1 Efflux pump membrane transporter BepG [Pontiella desulfatans]